MNKLLVTVLLFAGVVRADDACTIDFTTLYSSPSVAVTPQADGTATMDDEAAQAWAAYVLAVAAMGSN